MPLTADVDVPVSSTRRRRLDAAIATIASAIVFLVYVRTLYPGVGGGGDSTKFQYLGRVLGTAHPPGYPLYVFVSFAFSFAPIGTLAYRMNLLSALLAAVTVGICYLILRRLGCGRWASVCAAVAVGFDRFLWEKAVIAEVYTLAAVLAAAIVLLALRWRASRRDRDLYVVAAVFGLALGNHLTVAMLFPALGAFVIVALMRVPPLRVILTCALLTALGLTQYAFIIVRTLQRAPYVEAHATGIRELYSVVGAAPYADEIFPFSAAQLLHVRLPLLWTMAQQEFGWLGLALFAIGAAALIVKQRDAAAFLLIAAAGILALTLNVDADVEGFVVSAFVLCWIIAGVGLHALWSWPTRFQSGRAAVVLLAAVLPIAELNAHYKINDHHRRTFEIEYLTALFAQLGDRTAIVREAYSVDQLILYKVAGERANGPRVVELVPADAPTVERYASNGYAVYAFSGARAALEGRGFGFEPVHLSEVTPVGRPAGQPIDMNALPVFRVIKHASCVALGNAGWKDISAIPSDQRLMLRIDNYRPFNSEAVLYVGGNDVPPPELVLAQGPSVPTVAIDTFRTGEPRQIHALREALMHEALPAAASTLIDTPVVHRLRLRVNDDGQFSLSALTFGERPRVAWLKASVDLNNPLRAQACGWAGHDLLQGRVSEDLPLDQGGDAYLWRGWSDAEHTAEGDLRFVTAELGDVLMPLASRGPLRLTLETRATDGRAVAGSRVSIAVNGIALATTPLTVGWMSSVVAVPATATRAGLNRLTISVADGARGVAVRRMTFSSDTRSGG